MSKGFGHAFKSIPESFLNILKFENFFFPLRPFEDVPAPNDIFQLKSVSGLLRCKAFSGKKILIIQIIEFLLMFKIFAVLKKIEKVTKIKLEFFKITC